MIPDLKPDLKGEMEQRELGMVGQGKVGAYSTSLSSVREQLRIQKGQPGLQAVWILCHKTRRVNACEPECYLCTQMSFHAFAPYYVCFG